MTATTFSELELDDRLALRDKGYDRPTAIQAEAIPPAMDARRLRFGSDRHRQNRRLLAARVAAPALDFPRKKSAATRTDPYPRRVS